jgi:hypothetical protein
VFLNGEYVWAKGSFLKRKNMARGSVSYKSRMSDPDPHGTGSRSGSRRAKMTHKNKFKK